MLRKTVITALEEYYSKIPPKPLEEAKVDGTKVCV
jgi:hypothetical protein